MADAKKTCGNCRTVQPFSKTHVKCLCTESKSCGCLKSVSTGGCKQWTGGAE